MLNSSSLCSAEQRVHLRSKCLRTLWVTGLLGLSGLLNPAVGSSGRVLAQAGAAKPQAAAAARVVQRQQQVRQIQPQSYNLKRYPVTDSNEAYWRNLLWTTAIVEPQEAYVAEALRGILALSARPQLSRSQRRTIEMAMQVGTQLYAGNSSVHAKVGQQFLQTVEGDRNPEWVAMALSGLRQGDAPVQLRQLSDRVKVRFPNWSENVFLRTTLQDVAESLAPTPVPPLGDLLQRTIGPGQFHLFVLCRPNRETLCQAILRDRSGQFRRENGQLWSVPLLLRSIHSLGWNFIRGQTPQGIYRIEGVMPVAEDPFFRAYGQFPLVKLFMPFESGARQFLPGRSGRFTGPLSTYQALLPPSWRNYTPMQQSYWAGKIGRSLFRIHGSGEAPDFFSKQERYPDSYNWNPTIGCLSAIELYDQAGKLQQADMPKILKALTAAGGKNFSGYAVVVEIPSSAQTPVSLAEVEAALPASDVGQSAAR